MDIYVFIKLNLACIILKMSTFKIMFDNVADQSTWALLL
jgi:hypothetical protein